jgi:hypothetical protein
MSTKTGSDLVEEYRRELTTEADSRPVTEHWQDYPAFDKPLEIVLSDLEHAWRAIVAGAGAPMLPLLSEFRNLPMEEFGDHPLVVISLFIRAGHYPPPELLLAVVAMYQAYIAGKGELTLEECFFGKPKPKAGNYAAQCARKLKELIWTINVAVASGDAQSGIHAAEEIVRRDGLDIDPETVLRAVNKHSKRVKPEK